DKIIVETVGVGQDEIDIVKTADVTVVVLVPGMGDDIQAIKAGIMEIGDVFVINKSDREGVLRTEKELEAMLSISQRPDGWTPPIVKTIAIRSSGIDELAGAIGGYAEFLKAGGPDANGRRTAVAEHRIMELLRDQLLRRALEKGLTQSEFKSMARMVAERRQD